MPNVNGKMFPYTAEGKAAAAAAAEKANMPSYKHGGVVSAKGSKYSKGHKQKSMTRT
jgi:hypothetical protein|tara:strand:- start:1004 stop:1174 length:171 start_codon:yes stop_codon:yes gene_type:complete